VRAVLERVLHLGKEAGLVEELRGLEGREGLAEGRLRLLDQRLQQRDGDIRPDDRRGLEEALLLGRQPIDTGGQDGLHGRGHLNARQSHR
jgi:hypothetical protein